MQKEEAEFNFALKHAALAHDRRLRKHVLAVLYELRISLSGWTGAIALRDTIGSVMPPDEGFVNDDHCIGICRDLTISGFTEERLNQRRRGNKFGLKWLEYRITMAGLALVTESAPPNPLVDDDRVQIPR